jgi:hypothetical protein
MCPKNMLCVTPIRRGRFLYTRACVITRLGSLPNTTVALISSRERQSHRCLIVSRNILAMQWCSRFTGHSTTFSDRSNNFRMHSRIFPRSCRQYHDRPQMKHPNDFLGLSLAALSDESLFTSLKSEHVSTYRRQTAPQSLFISKAERSVHSVLSRNT